MVECANPFTQPRPGERLPKSAGESAQFVSRVVRFDTFTVEEFTRKWGVLDVSAAEPVPWWLRLSGFHRARHDEDAPAPVDPSLIRSGVPTFPGQAVVEWQDNALGAGVVFDVGGGVTLWVPPTRQITVSVLLPVASNRVQNGGFVGPDNIGVAGGEFQHMLFGASAQPTCCEAGIRAATMTVRRDVAAAGTTMIPIPAGATHVTAYDGPFVDGGAAPLMAYRFVLFEEAPIRPLCDFTPGIRQAIPRGSATAVQVFGDPAVLGRTCLAFELEY